MFKKTLISLAVASSVGLTGCFDSGETGANANPDYQITDTTINESLVRPLFDPIITSETFSVPTGFDLIYLLGATRAPSYDFTGFATGSDFVSTALNDLEGASTTAPIDIPFNGELDPDTAVLGDTVHLVPIKMNPLAPGVAENIELTANPSFIDLDATGGPYDTTKLASQKVRVEVIDSEEGTNTVLRITPLEPLASQTKYVVIVTDGLKASDNRSTAQSVAFQNTIGDGPLFESFGTIRDVLNGAVSLAQGWQQVNSNTDGLTLAYTMTTANTRTVFDAITSPATYLTTLGEQVVLYSALGAAREVLESRATQYETVTGSDAFEAVQDALSDSPEDLEVAQAVGAAVQPYLASQQAGDDPSLAGQIVGSAVSGLPFPKPRTAKFYSDTSRTADNLATVAATGGALAAVAASVSVTEGGIELPYYLDLPGDEGAGLVNGVWRGSETLETTMNETIDALKATNPTLRNFEFPRDSDGTFNVTQYMPFPEEKAKVAVPVVAFYPESATCDNSITDVVLFQHGITTDRSVATIPAINIVAQSLGSACVAVVAIDQPLHGLGGNDDPDDNETELPGRVSGLTAAGDYMDANDFSDDAIVGERHFMFSEGDEPFVPEMKTDILDVESGSLFLNLTSFATARDNNRQGVLDLLNLAATIKSGGFDLDGDGGRFTALDLQGANFHFVGHSLGGITGTVFSALATDPVLRGTYVQSGIPASSTFYPDLESVSLMNTGGQLTRLVENSQDFGPLVLGALNNLAPQGSATFETFLNVFQATVDGVDPANYGKALGENSVSGDFGLLISEVTGDRTVPNEANVNPAQLGNFVGANSSPLAGTEPLMALADLGAGGTLLNTEEADGLQLVSLSNPDLVAPTARAASFIDGTDPCTQANHSTFVAPANPESTDRCPSGYNTQLAFTQMIGEVIGNITSKTIPITEAGVLDDSDTIDDALDQN